MFLLIRPTTQYTTIINTLLYFWLFFSPYERQMLKKSYNDTINYLTHERSCCYSWKLQNILSSRCVIVYLKFLLILDMKINTKYPVTSKLLFYRKQYHMSLVPKHMFSCILISLKWSHKRERKVLTLCLGERERELMGWLCAL